MRVDISKITSAINKISDLTNSDKSKPGILFNIQDLESNKLEICYSDGHKSLIETIEADIEPTDRLGGFVVNFEQITRVISNCQPTGRIKVSDIHIEFVSDSIIRISADQFIESLDEYGNAYSVRKLATKKMDLLWEVPGATLKTSVISRMKFNTIFETDGIPDEYSRVDFIDMLNRTSTEKQRQIYISSKEQAAFVVNQAHLTEVPIKGFQFTQDEIENIKHELLNSNTLTDEELDVELSKHINRVHQSLVLFQNHAKSLIGILGKIKSDNIFVHRKDSRYLNIFVDTDDEKVGIWLEMPQANRAHTTSLERYNEKAYSHYQLVFIKDFLEDSIKSAKASNKTDNTTIQIVDTEVEVAGSPYDLVISSGSTSASISDTYRVNIENLIDTIGDINNKTFKISLKVFDDMLSQLKSDYVALDFCIDAQNVVSVRLAELDINTYDTLLRQVRKGFEERCLEEGVEFDPYSTPTPIEDKIRVRNAAIGVKQYTLLSR